MRIIFMGTPDFSVPTLSELIGAGHEIVAVYSQPPRRAGRGMAHRPSPVHAFAEARGLQVLTPTTLKTVEEQDIFAAFKADAAVVVAYGLLLPTEILKTPVHGCFNLHASALPRWRGAAPIQRAIMAGDTSTAVMVMQMAEGLDTGPVCLAETVEIPPDMTASELHDALADVGGRLMVRALAAVERGTMNSQAQSDEGVCYASKIDKAESRIDFSKDACDVHNLIRGLSPFPGAWFETLPADAQAQARPERIKVLSASRIDETELKALSGKDGEIDPGILLDDQLTVSCGKGAIRLTKVQRAGKKPADAAQFLRGFSLQPGHRL